MLALIWVFCDLRVLVRKLASPLGHPTQISTQVQLGATCDYGQGYRLAGKLRLTVKLFTNPEA